jgi:hypothetical protein
LEEHRYLEASDESDFVVVFQSKVWDWAQSKKTGTQFKLRFQLELTIESLCTRK